MYFVLKKEEKEQQKLAGTARILGSFNRTSKLICEGDSPSLISYQAYLQKSCLFLTKSTKF